MSDPLLVPGSVVSVAGGAADPDCSASEEMGFESAEQVGKGYRRREPRFVANENRIWLQWWQNGEYLGQPARLVNVSRNGAMIVSWNLIPKHQRIRIYLEEPAHEVGVNAIVLDLVEGTKGMHQLRLRFITPCPDGFIEAAANGFEAWLAGQRPRY